MVWGTYIFWQWVVVLKLEDIGKGSSKPSFESGGLFWDDVGENAEGWKTEGLCLMRVEIRHDLEGRKKDRNYVN